MIARGVCLSLVLLSWISPAPQQVPTFTSGIEAVRVDVLPTARRSGHSAALSNTRHHRVRGA